MVSAKIAGLSIKIYDYIRILGETVQEIKAKLIQRIKRTPSIESFRFETENTVDFKPGQFLHVIFDRENRKNKDLNKYLSFSSSPLKEYFEITKRISTSEFSRRLTALKQGDEVLFKAPLGHVIFDENEKKIGFLIGGIGITPVISILEYIVEKEMDTDVELIYSNRNEEEIAFKAELDAWKNTNSNLKICYTITDCKPQDQTCIHGFISKDLVCEGIADLDSRAFYIYGPPGMVSAMKKLCLDSGCSTDRIKAENFIGY